MYPKAYAQQRNATAQCQYRIAATPRAGAQRMLRLRLRLRRAYGRLEPKEIEKLRGEKRGGEGGHG